MGACKIERVGRMLLIGKRTTLQGQFRCFVHCCIDTISRALEASTLPFNSYLSLISADKGPTMYVAVSNIIHECICIVHIVLQNALDVLIPGEHPNIWDDKSMDAPGLIGMR